METEGRNLIQALANMYTHSFNIPSVSSVLSVLVHSLIAYKILFVIVILVPETVKWASNSLFL